MIISQKPCYRSIIQKPYCCVSAVISMLLNRRKIKHGSQEEIGWFLGLTVLEKDAHYFKKVRIGKKPLAGYGTQVNLKKYFINNYFKKNEIRLKERYYSPLTIKDYEIFIEEQIIKNNDIIACLVSRI